jgi:hypothetical protein
MLLSTHRARTGLILLTLALLLGLLPAGCRREAQAPGDPVAAVKGLAAALRDNDLVRYSRLSVPPALHEQLERRWSQELAAASAPSEAERKKFDQMMQRLTEADAETRLYRSAENKLKRFEAEINSQWPLMKATLSIFAVGMIQANGQLGSASKAHAESLAGAVLDSLEPQRLTDRALARRAVATVVATARSLDVKTLEDSRRLEMLPLLEKAGIVLRGLKQLGLVYGVDVDAALAGVEAEVASVDGDIATMRVRYPLLGRSIEFEMPLQRIDGRWYDAEAVASARAKLKLPLTP